MSGKKKTIIIVALLLVVFIGSISYALWSVTLEQTGSNVVKTGCFTVNMKEESDAISLAEAYPILDSEGWDYDPFVFTIQNTCTIDSSYSVNLEVGKDTTLSESAVKTVLDFNEPKVLTEYETVTHGDDIKSKYQLTTGTLAGASSEGADDGESITYNLRLWLDENTPEEEMSKDFYAKIVVENITTSGVVARELLSTVDYSKTESDDVILNYYSDGSVEIVGSGEMNGNGLLTDIALGISTNEKFQEEVALVPTLSETSQGMINAMMLLSLGSYKYSYQITGETMDLSYITNNEELYTEAEKLVETTGMIPEEEQETVLKITKKITGTVANIKSIKIEEGITNIGSSMFRYIDIDTLRLPSTILEIEQSAFEDSDMEVVLNEGLEYIGDHAFNNAGITKINIPDSLIAMEYNAFSNSMLTSVVIPSGTNVWGHAFEGCPELTKVVWETDDDIGGSTFTNTPKLTDVYIKSNITYLATDSFDDLSVNPNLVIKFAMSEDNKSTIEGDFDFTKYNIIWGYTE